MAIVVRNPTCSREEKVIRKQSPSSERWDFHQHVKVRLVTQSLELFNKRVDELTLPLMPVQMTNMSQVWRSSASEGQDSVAFYCNLFHRNFQKIGGNSYLSKFFAWCITLENKPLQFSTELADRNLTFLLTRKLAATARPCVKLSMVLASRLRYPLICKEKEDPLIKEET